MAGVEVADLPVEAKLAEIKAVDTTATGEEEASEKSPAVAAEIPEEEKVNEAPVVAENGTAPAAAEVAEEQIPAGEPLAETSKAVLEETPPAPEEPQVEEVKEANPEETPVETPATETTSTETEAQEEVKEETPTETETEVRPSPEAAEEESAIKETEGDSPSASVNVEEEKAVSSIAEAEDQKIPVLNEPST